jgi:hypothetical protein
MLFSVRKRFFSEKVINPSPIQHRINDEWCANAGIQVITHYDYCAGGGYGPECAFEGSGYDKKSAAAGFDQDADDGSREPSQYWIGQHPGAQEFISKVAWPRFAIVSASSRHESGSTRLGDPFGLMP